MTVVLDASALLAFLLQEPGAEVVDGLLSDARMASVNWAEVVQKSLSAGVDVAGMQVEPFLAVDGELAGQLWPLTRQRDLSLGDRACLSLGLRTWAEMVMPSPEQAAGKGVEQEGWGHQDGNGASSTSSSSGGRGASSTSMGGRCS